MEIFAIEGYKVIVTERSKNNGYDYDKEQVNRYLEVGKVYEVERTEVGRSHTDVYLKEFPDVNFNSVNFEGVEDQSKEQSMTHPDWEKYNGR